MKPLFDLLGKAMQNTGTTLLLCLLVVVLGGTYALAQVPLT